MTRFEVEIYEYQIFFSDVRSCRPGKMDERTDPAHFGLALPLYGPQDLLGQQEGHRRGPAAGQAQVRGALGQDQDIHARGLRRREQRQENRINVV